MVATKLLTIEKFTSLKEDHLMRELVEGEVFEVSPAGTKHLLLVSALVRMLNRYADSQDDIFVLVGDGGFILRREPDSLLEPDIAITTIAQITAMESATGTFSNVLPLIVIEVKSPTDRESQIARKLAAYLEAGVQEVWWVRPERREVTIHVSDIGPVQVSEGNVVRSPLLPGFVLDLTELFKNHVNA